MSVPGTEQADPRYAGLDSWPGDEILDALLEGQKRALESISAAIPALAQAAEAAAQALRGGGRLIYVAAGSPALIALGDALELPQTYGIASDRLVLIFAGGMGIVENFVGGPEDDAGAAQDAVAAHAVSGNDCVLCISASGTTPFTLAGLRAAKARGASTVGIASNPGAPLLEEAAVPVLLETGPEVISGSTRMGAGTAQKAALNMISTLAGVKLGHVHDNLMVNVTADNDKLVKRATKIVAQAAGVSEDAARSALQLAGQQVKPAIILAAGASSLSQASAMLEASGGVVRSALQKMQRA